MTIYDEIDQLEKLISFVENELPKYAERVAANDLAALIADRVINKGENYRGGNFSSYSTNPIPAWKLWGKSRNQSAEKKIRSLASQKGANGKRQSGALSYQEFRKLNNLETNNKNFEFTGEMWKKFKPLQLLISGKDFKIIIGGSTPAAQEKIDENSRREGLSIIEPNEKEIGIVQRTSLAWLEEQAIRILNA